MSCEPQQLMPYLASVVGVHASPQPTPNYFTASERGIEKESMLKNVIRQGEHARMSDFVICATLDKLIQPTCNILIIQ